MASFTALSLHDCIVLHSAKARSGFVVSVTESAVENCCSVWVVIWPLECADLGLSLRVSVALLTWWQVFLEDSYVLCMMLSTPGFA